MIALSSAGKSSPTHSFIAPQGGSRRLSRISVVTVTLLFLYLSLPFHQPVSTAHASPTTQVSATGRLYPETGYTLAPQFVDFYDRHGAVPIFGYPVSDARMENGFLVQWTERQRLEWHPEQASTDFQVQLGLTRSRANTRT